MALKQTGVELVTKNAAGFLSTMNRADKATKTFGSSMRGGGAGVNFMTVAIGNLVSGAIRNVAGLFMDAGRAATGFLVDGVNMAADLEAQMDAVGAIMGLTNDEVALLSTLTKDLGLDPNLKVTSVEAAEAIEMLGRNGLSLTEIMDGAARGTILLANATGADFSTAADVATDAMAVFGVGAEDMTDVVNGLLGVTNNSKFTVNDYALALRNGGAAAADMGVSLKDFNVAVAASAEELGSGMRAGTGYRAFITRLTPNTKVATGVMKELGLITAEGGNAFFDATGEMKSMNEVAVILNDAISGLSGEQRSAALETIFGADALGTALALSKEGEVVYTDLATASKELGIEQSVLNQYIDDGITGFEILSAQMDLVDANEAAATRVDNFRGKLDIALGVVEAIQLSIGEKLLPMLSDLAEKFTSLADENSEQIISFFTNIAESISAFVIAATDAFMGGESPFQAMMTGLQESGIPPETIETINKIKDVIVNVGTFLVDYGPTIASNLGLMYAGFVAFNILSTVTSLISGVTVAFGLLSTSIATSGTVMGGIVAFLGGPVTIAIALVAAAVAGLYIAWQNNFLGIQDVVASAMPKIQAFISKGMDFIKGIVASVLSQVMAFWAAHGDSIKTIVNAFISFVVGQFNMWKSQLTSIVNGIVSVVMGIWNIFGADIIAAAQIYIDGIVSLWEGFKAILGGIVDAIAAAIEGDWVEFGASLRRATDAFFGLIKTAFETGKALLVNAVNSIITAITTLWNDFSWSSLGTAVADGLSGGIIAGIEKVKNAALSMANAAKSAVTGFFGIQSPSRLFAWIAEMVVSGFVNTINESKSAISEAAKSAFDFTGVLDGISSSAANIFKRDVIGGIQDTIDQAELDYSAALNSANREFAIAKLTEEERRGIDERKTVLNKLAAEIEGFENGTIGGSLSEVERSAKLKILKKDYKDMFEGLEADLQSMDFTPFDALSHKEQLAEYFRAVEEGNTSLAESIQLIWKQQGRVNEATNEYEAAQQKLLDIQKKQQDIGFLKSQMELLTFIQENGLNASEILGDTQLGSGADPGAILDATAAAFDRVIAAVSGALSPANPIQGDSSNVSSNVVNNSVNVTGTFQNQPVPTLSNSLNSVLANL